MDFVPIDELGRVSINFGGVYQIRCLINNHSYVGSSHNIGDRFIRGHLYPLRNNLKSDTIQSDFTKYGEANFVAQILERVDDPEKLKEVEFTYISELKPEYNTIIRIVPESVYLDFASDGVALKKFWAKVNTTEQGKCWEFKTGRKTGYASFSYKYISLRAHRASFFLTYGRLPVGGDCRHLCNNKACVNPTHLSEGSATKNCQDKKNFHSYKCTHEIAKLIRGWWTGGLELKEISIKLSELGHDIGHGYMRSIIQNRSFQDKNYTNNKRRDTVSKDTVSEIRRQYSAGIKVETIVENFNSLGIVLHKANIIAIGRNKIYKDPTYVRKDRVKKITPEIRSLMIKLRADGLTLIAISKIILDKFKVGFSLSSINRMTGVKNGV